MTPMVLIFNLFYWQDRTAYKFLLFPSIFLLLRWWIWDAFQHGLFRSTRYFVDSKILFVFKYFCSTNLCIVHKSNLNNVFLLLRLGYYSCTQALLCGRMHWLRMEVTFVHGKDHQSFTTCMLKIFKFFTAAFKDDCECPFIKHSLLSVFK